jgi:hypothetical protein
VRTRGCGRRAVHACPRLRKTTECPPIGTQLRNPRAVTGPRSLTMKDLLRPETGMVVLAEEPEVETLVGSVGRFWERDYGWRRVGPEEFPGFDEPGYAKLAIDLWVQPAGDGGSLLRYEARTATTDQEARRRFRWYWRLIRPGVGLVMGRAVFLIRREAEGRFLRGTPESEPEASRP